MLVIKNKTKKTQIRVFTSLSIVFGEKVVHVESLLSCVVIWFHFGLTQQKSFVAIKANYTNTQFVMVIIEHSIAHTQ